MANYDQPGAVEQRVRFFDGQYLQDQDFVDEQKYHLDRERRLAKTLRITGIMEGLGVTSAKANQVTIDPGTAIDNLGRMLVLSADLTAQQRLVDLPGAKFNSKQGIKVYIVFQQTQTEQATTGIQSERRWLERPKLVGISTDGQSSDTTVQVDANRDVLLTQLNLDGSGRVTLVANSAQFAGMSLNGNVGIGTSSPAAKLSFNNVDDGSNRADGITWHNPAPTSYGIHRTAGAWAAPDYQQLRLGWMTGIVLDPGTTYGKSYVDIQGNGLRVTAGHVGIGTSSPENAENWGKVLDVLGSAGTKLSVRTANVEGRMMVHDTGFWNAPAGIIIGTKTNHPLSFGTNAAARMTIDTAGNVGIGQTNPPVRLAVSGTSATTSIETADVVRLLRPGVMNVKNNNSAGFKLGSFETGVNGRARLDINLSGAPGDANGWGTVPDVTVMSLLANGNVGIGTTGPTSALHVAIAKSVRFELGSSQKLSLGGNGSFEVDAPGVVGGRFVVTQGGNVGIGTTSPGAKLSFGDTNDGRNTADGITWLNSVPTAYSIHRTVGAWTAPDYQQLRLGWQTGMILDPGTAYGKSYVDIQGNGLRVTSGNVGIGVTNPEDTLQISNFAAGDRYITLTTEGGSAYRTGIKLWAWQKNWGFKIEHDERIAGLNITRHGFKADGKTVDAEGVSALFVNSNGHVGVGTTSPATVLHVRQPKASNGIRLEETNASGVSTGRYLQIHYEGQGTVVFYHQHGIGQYMTQSGDWSKNSDRSLKQDIAPLQGMLDKVMQLKPVTYQWQSTKAADLGFIAQDVEQVFPELVSSVTIQDKPVKGLPYTAFGVLAIAAIQELKRYYDEKFEALARNQPATL